MKITYIALLLGLCALAHQANADTIILTGTVTQNLVDSGETAVNNPSLNSIMDGDTFQVMMGFSGSITGPGTTGITAIQFDDITASVTENGFISGNLSVDSASPDYQLFAVACLTAQPECSQGNELLLSFQIPISGLDNAGVTAETIAGLSPSLDLLEDDGNTEIQGAVSLYTYQPAGGTVTTPEPSTLWLLGGALAFVALRARRFQK